MTLVQAETTSYRVDVRSIGAVAILPADDDARRQQYRIAAPLGADSHPVCTVQYRYSTRTVPVQYPYSTRTVPVQYPYSISVLRPDLVGTVPVIVGSLSESRLKSVHFLVEETSVPMTSSVSIQIIKINH